MIKCTVCGETFAERFSSAPDVCLGCTAPGSVTMTDDLFVRVNSRYQRVSWGDYFLNIAVEVSKRSTCDRKAVGAVIVRDRSILATGYNGSMAGARHCDEVGHDMDSGHCARTVHAEANAIAQAARHGHAVEGATIYCNTYPCWPCFKLIANAGIVKIICVGTYGKDPRVATAADGNYPSICVVLDKPSAK